MNSELKPKIRFKGFTDDWEQRKLENEVTDLIAGGDIDKNNSVEKGKYPIYANALVNDGIVGFYNDYFRVKAPAVTVTGRGEIGHAVARDLDFTPVVRLLSLKSNHYNHFLARAINNLNVVSESTGVPQLTVPQLGKYEIKFPKSIDEETQIGNIFIKIDNLITLHQRKCDKLIKLKKSLMEKMFPQNNSKIPEIRFKDYIGNWKVYNYSDLFDKVESGNRLPREMLIIGSIPYVVASLTNNGIIAMISKDSRDYHGNKMKLFNSNSITFSIDNPDAIFVQNKPFFTSNIMRVLYNSNYNLNHLKFLSESLKTLTRNYNWSFKFSGPVVMKSDIKVPVDSYEKVCLNEINKIGKLINNLDDLIALYDKKNKKLNKIKQSLLNDMFV